MAKDHLSRKLAVLLHADVVGSTSLVQKNEAPALELVEVKIIAMAVIADIG
jgi:hypothetical protein